MRPYHASGAVAVVCMLVLAVPGCLEIETTTRVNDDGTLHRMVEVTGDSSTLASGDYPVALGGQWETTLDRADDKKFRLRATRTFQNVDELNEAIRGEPGRTLAFQARLERRFLWFTTTFRYEETLARFYPFNEVPVTEFVSPHEIDLFLHHELEDEPYPTPGDSLALDDASDRFDEWEKRNRFEAFFRELMTGVERAADPQLTPEKLAAGKEELYRLAFQNANPARAEHLAEVAADRFGKGPIDRAREANREGFDAYERKIDFLESVASTGFKTKIEMPGLITDTNARTIEGNTVSWPDFKAYTYVRDYTVWVESRMINWWAIIITGVIVLAIMALFAVSALRRRPSPAVA